MSGGAGSKDALTLPKKYYIQETLFVIDFIVLMSRANLLFDVIQRALSFTLNRRRYVERDNL